MADTTNTAAELLRQCHVLDHYYCDNGLHAGKEAVTLHGYFDPEQIPVLWGVIAGH